MLIQSSKSELFICISSIRGRKLVFRVTFLFSTLFCVSCISRKLFPSSLHSGATLYSFKNYEVDYSNVLILLGAKV